MGDATRDEPSGNRYLYLVRHGEAAGGGELTERGRSQAVLVGRRLRAAGITEVHHGPLPRATETARIMAAELGAATLTCTDLAGDYIPYLPPADDPETAYAAFFDSCGDPADGPALAEQAVARFAAPSPADVSEVVVTHNFLVAWMVTQALGMRPERWPGFNQCNTGVTVLRYRHAMPPALLLFNDLSHLPADLRWTGFPAALHAG